MNEEDDEEHTNFVNPIIKHPAKFDVNLPVLQHMYTIIPMST